MKNEPKHLLLVSAQPGIPDAVRKWCDAQNVSVHHEGDSADVLSGLAAHTFHVALIDQDLPGSSGVQLLQEINQKFPNIVCILRCPDDVLLGCRDTINDCCVFRVLITPCQDASLLRVLADAFTFYDCRLNGADVNERIQRLTYSWQTRFEEKNLEVAMQARRLLIANMIFDMLPDVMLGVGTDGLVVEANERARQLFQGDPLVGCRVEELMSKDALAVIRKCLSGEGVTSAAFAVTVHGQRVGFRCFSIIIGGTLTGCLVYGGAPV